MLTQILLSIDGSITVNHGTVVADGSGKYLFTPEQTYAGEVEFTFKVSMEKVDQLMLCKNYQKDTKQSEIQVLQAQLSDLVTSLLSKTASLQQAQDEVQTKQDLILQLREDVNQAQSNMMIGRKEFS